MSDEHQRRGGADETRQFDPSGGAGNQPVGGPRSSDPGPADNTEPMPRSTGDDETVLTPRADSTTVMPAAVADAAWSGRAEVRPPRPSDFPSGGWYVVPAAPREPRGKWWTPIVVGIVVLLLLALLGWGLWLILQAGSKDDPTTPAVTASAAAPTTVQTTPPTTEPTTQPTTTEPTQPAEVTIPALKGLSSAEARQALDRTGLSYRLRFVTSGDAPAGMVIDSDPREGQQVPTDSTVTLIIAAAPSSPAVSTTPTSTAPTDTSDDQAGGN
jgi:pyruvate/2-oxoglutarate dehydrogenase complex dihydrolipoamide acyltransferase (E2) component